MRRFRVRGSLAWLLAILWAGAHASNPAHADADELAPPPPHASASEPAPMSPAEATGLDETDNSGRNRRQSNNRILLDPAQILSLQMQAIHDPNAHEADGREWRGNRFTSWLDRTHEQIYCRLDNAVRRLDTLWLPEGAEYDYKVSTFRLRLMTRAGGRGNESDFNMKVRLNTRLALPRVEQQLYLFVDNIGRDDLPGADPLTQESDTRIGLRSERLTKRNTKVDLSGGVRVRSSSLVGYGDLTLRRRWAPGEWNIALFPSLFYYSDDGFGQMLTLVCTRPLDDRRTFQSRTVERSTEATRGVEFEQTFRMAWYRSGRKRGWIAEGSAFPHLKSSSLYWDNARASLTWRDALYKRWVYYTVTLQTDMAREDSYEPRPSVRVGMEIQFGGQVPDLM